MDKTGCLLLSGFVGGFVGVIVAVSVFAAALVNHCEFKGELAMIDQLRADYAAVPVESSGNQTLGH